MKSLMLASAAAIAALALPASAASLNAPVPTNATINYGGLQWAWASPLEQTTVDLSYQSQFGWRLPTAQELLNAPSAMDFMFAGANVPLGGTDPISGVYFAYTAPTLDSAAALAVAYFSSYDHGDWCNAPGSACGFGEVPWNTGNYYNESLVVRAIAGGVPEPATWALMILGFGAVGMAMRGKRRVSAKVRLA